MSYEPSGPKKQCPERGWDVTGEAKANAKVGSSGIPPGGKLPEATEPIAYDYQCGNCGQEWTQSIE